MSFALRLLLILCSCQIQRCTWCQLVVSFRNMYHQIYDDEDEEVHSRSRRSVRLTLHYSILHPVHSVSPGEVTACD